MTIEGVYVYIYLKEIELVTHIHLRLNAHNKSHIYIPCWSRSLSKTKISIRWTLVLGYGLQRYIYMLCCFVTEVVSYIMYYYLYNNHKHRSQVVSALIDFLISPLSKQTFTLKTTFAWPAHHTKRNENCMLYSSISFPIVYETCSYNSK